MLTVFLYIAYLVFACVLFYTIHKQPKIQYHSAKPYSPIKCVVVVPFRNEVNKLPILIQSIRALKTQHQVSWVFVNDHSTDGGESLITQSDNTTLINLPENNTCKKQALIFGLERHEANCFICIDADVSFNADWLDNLLAPIVGDKASWVIGPVNIASTGSSFLSTMQNIEWQALQKITHYFALLQKPILCNGANLAFSSTLKAFALDALKNQTTASGDDLSLMQEFKRINAKVCFGNNAATVNTDFPDTWKGFVNQKLRWAKKMNGQWNSTTKIGLLMAGFQVLLLLVWLFGSIKNALLCTVIKFVADSLIANNFNVLNIPYWSMLQIYPLILWIIQPFVRLQWKDREIKA